MSTLAIAEAPTEQLESSQAGPTPTHTASPNIQRIANTVVLALIFAAPALMCVHAACVIDPDIWWHLRTGEWILNHHAVPRLDSFSAPLAGKPWQAYSWLFDVLVSKLFSRFGLVGIVVYTSAMVLAITIALQRMLARVQTDFSLVGLLTFATCFSFAHLFTPRPWLFTILFFVLELDILMEARRSGRTRGLVWLPLIFVVWSNIHIQFIDGLIVLGLALAEAVGARWKIGVGSRLKAGPLWVTLLASAVATFANPYGWHIYQTAYGLASQSGVMSKITELQAIPFRDINDFLVLFLALGATAALAWRRDLRVFEIGLLAFAAVVSFRSQRDVWVIAISAAAILAATIHGRPKPAIRLPRFATKLALAGAALAVVVGFPAMHVRNEKLDIATRKVLPVNAVEFVKAKGYAGPLYNNFDWGGYLIWSLRLPVSMDGRAALYGDQLIDRSYGTWNGGPDWNTDPQLRNAGLVIGYAQAALTQLLRNDPRYQLVYEDKLAAVFIARR